MVKLRNKMVMWFLVITFGAGILNTLLEVIFDFAAPYIQQTENEVLFMSTVFLMLFSSIMIYIISGFVFYLVTRKAIQKESERQIREKDLIYAAVAHDLKTPMTSVQGFAKALSDGKVKPNEQQEIFDIIYHKSNSMNDMVNTLFEYAKLGTEEYKPVMSSIDLSSLVRDIAAENYTDFEERNIALDIDIPDEAITVNGDKNELKRAVSNLVVNVYKHNPNGIQAKISVGRENNKAVIMIADSGNNIPDDMDIFKPFITENSARTIGYGTGLGLAITKRIIERHGGELYLDENVEGYSKAFVAEIPILAEK